MNHRNIATCFILSKRHTSSESLMKVEALYLTLKFSFHGLAKSLFQSFIKNTFTEAFVFAKKIRLGEKKNIKKHWPKRSFKVFCDF